MPGPSWDTDRESEPQGAEMEERALYRAILDTPHDDTARLVYADWLDEFADTLPEPQARLERGRAELIRVQCLVARRGPGGWCRNRGIPIPPELLKRQKRLRFLFSEKLRRGLPEPLAGHPFDRGFLRPLRWLRPGQLLGTTEPGHPVPPLPRDHPMRRYVAGDEPFDVFPLWDVHLYARADAGYPFDSWADFGQYGEPLARCARLPALARIGLLKVSFFRTPTVEFFRTGRFANVEALILNCGPFPDVLEAVAGNESFRSLRYVEFGEDDWAWAVTPAARERLAELEPKLRELNGRHLPYGEMRTALGAVLHDRPMLPPQPIMLPRLRPESPRTNELPIAVPPGTSSQPGCTWQLLFLFIVFVVRPLVLGRGDSPRPPEPQFNYNTMPYQVPPATDGSQTRPTVPGDLSGSRTPGFTRPPEQKE